MEDHGRMIRYEMASRQHPAQGNSDRPETNIISRQENPLVGCPPLSDA